MPSAPTKTSASSVSPELRVTKGRWPCSPIDIEVTRALDRITAPASEARSFKTLRRSPYYKIECLRINKNIQIRLCSGTHV